jgi:hypothetical protein
MLSVVNICTILKHDAPMGLEPYAITDENDPTSERMMV